MSADDIKGDFTIEGTNIVGTVTNNSANDIVDLGTREFNFTI